MHLLNFDLAQAYDATELEGLGLTWDLHNVLEFRGFELRSEPHELLLRWDGDPHYRVVGDVVEDNPLGYAGCALRFRGVETLRLITPASPTSGDLSCVHAISKVRPGDGEYRYRLDWTVGNPFHLVLEFVSGVQLEIGAWEAELVGISAAAP